MIIGITGTVGAGKGTVVDYLVANKSFLHISARALWTEELEARGLPVDRDHMTALANELRAEHGADVFVRRALERAQGHAGSVVIESIRAIGEVELLKASGGVLLAVDADRELRYNRIHSRGSALDDVTYEDFVRQEAAEFENDDPLKQNIGKVMLMADANIVNVDSVEELHQQVDAVLEKINNAG